MKLRITISGPKVHDVGYRNFLMTQAIAGRIKMFEAYSIEGEQVQQVMILIDGGDKELTLSRGWQRSNALHMQSYQRLSLRTTTER
jgi:hypothetical protein